MKLLLAGGDSNEVVGVGWRLQCGSSATKAYGSGDLCLSIALEWRDSLPPAGCLGFVGVPNAGLRDQRRPTKNGHYQGIWTYLLMNLLLLLIFFEMVGGGQIAKLLNRKENSLKKTLCVSQPDIAPSPGNLEEPILCS